MLKFRIDLDRRLRLLLAAMIVVITAAVFLPSLPGELVNLEDDSPFADLGGGGSTNLLVQHGVNVLLHTINAVLFLILLEILLRRARPDDDARARLWASAAGALFFSIHPLRMEPVAWIDGRRDLLSGLFALLTVLAYLKFTGSARRLHWFLAVATFLVSLLCKTTSMGLPLVLLVLDVFPLKRFPSERLMSLHSEKLPFFLLMVGAALGTSLRFNGAVGPPIVERLLQSGARASFYGLKTFVPLRLSPLYMEQPGTRDLLAAGWLVMVAISVGVLLKRRSLPATAACWLAFVALIAPVSGCFPTGLSFAADRYSYLACLPFAALFATVLLLPAPRVGVAVRVGVATALLLLFTALSGVQVRIWSTSVTLWTHALWVDPNAYPAYNSRGLAMAALGNDDGAVTDYQMAIALRSDWTPPWNNQGLLMASRGSHVLAIDAFTRSLQIEPNQPDLLVSRGLSRIKVGDLSGARSDYEQALRIAPPGWDQRSKIEALLR